uniref:Uncharacterized protein n=1 Tax=Paramormyrops kingsleyae TaxID=1676925 RepID=A0A3B3S1X9_9TELE
GIAESDWRIVSTVVEADLIGEVEANEDFRLTFMFGNEEKFLKFIDVLSEQKTKILGSLAQMEACAVQLDKMKKGANISSVVGSTVGVGGGVVSIVGLALAPVTLGASTILTLVGGVLGAVSGANRLTTGITEEAINAREKQKFTEIYQKVLGDLEPIYKCLAQVIIIKDPSVENDCDGGTVGSVCRTVDIAVDCGRRIKLTVAKAAPTAFSMPSRAAFIAGNSALIGLDLFSIVNNSISLANGSKSDFREVASALSRGLN